MNLFYFSILITIAANLLYHLCQKNILPDAHPIVSIIFTYIVAIVVALLLLPFFPIKEGIITAVKKLNWASLVLGIALVGFETGYLLAYRAGWNLSVASLYVNVAIALILIPIGLYFFQETITWTKAAGILLCLIGIVLISR